MSNMEIPQKVLDTIGRYIRERLWGTIQIDFQDGEVILVRRTETEKVEHPKGNTHGLAGNQKRAS